MKEGNHFDDMKSERVRFKKKLRYCKHNEFLIRKQNFLNAKNNFWERIRKIFPEKFKSPTFVDGINDSSRISSLFRYKFKNLLDNKDSHIEDNERTCRVAPDDSSSRYFMTRELDSAINSLNSVIGRHNVQ